jgi:hypothetical protein
MNEGALGGSADKKQQPPPDPSLRSNLQTWLDAAQGAPPRTTTDNRRTLPTTPAAPDGAFRKGNDIVTPPPPKQGLGFSPWAGGWVGRKKGPQRSLQGGNRRRGRRRRRGHRRPEVSPGPDQPHHQLPGHKPADLTESCELHRSGAEISPDLTPQAGGGPRASHHTFTASPPPARPRTRARTTHGRRSPRRRQRRCHHPEPPLRCPKIPTGVTTSRNRPRNPRPRSWRRDSPSSAPAMAAAAQQPAPMLLRRGARTRRAEEGIPAAPFTGDAAFGRRHLWGRQGGAEEEGGGRRRA